jgi:VWFA-related protein
LKYRIALLVCCLAVLVSVPAGQQLPPVEPQTFRTGVDAVQLDVSVLDAERRPVRGLSAADFTVLDDGKPRRLLAFSAIELPPMPAAPPSAVDAVPPDVIRNDLPQGRLVVILIDPFLERVMVTGRVTIADPPGITALRATANRIVDSLGPADIAAVGHTIYGVPQNFTTDKIRLKRAIDSSAFGTNKRAEGLEWGNCNCGVCRLDAITRIADALRGESHRRKTVFLIGERVRLAPVPGTCNTYLEPATRRMLTATQLANVTVNTIDPNALETTNVHAGDDFRPAATDRAVSEAAKEQERANRASLIERQQSLRTVADWTGGRAILNANNPEDSVRPILEESSAYYLLAFEATDVKPDGRFHPVTVKVNRLGVQVRTRAGYYADAVTSARADTGHPPLEAISGALLPERGLPMSVAAATFRGPSGTPVVLLTTGVRADDAPRSSGQGPPKQNGPPQFEPIEILTSAYRDGQKDVDWQRQRLSIALPETGPGDLRYESVSTLALKPGTYELRVVSRHERTGVVGSVYTFVDVPDFASEPLAVAGPVWFDTRAPTATPPEALAGLLDKAPTTRRDYTAADDVSVRIRVYQRHQDKPVPVGVTFRVLQGAREVTATENKLEGDQFAATGAADATYSLPLELLDPGTFMLHVDASAGGTTIKRDVRFTVR